MKLGPDNSYPLGQPMFAGDRGGLLAGFSVVKDKRWCVMQFGTVLDIVGMQADEARTLAQSFRARVHENFGRLPYNPATLPLQVIAEREKNVVMVRLPQATSVLVANPEMWLGLADHLDRAAAELLRMARNRV
jgi:hypothetical protein